MTFVSTLYSCDEAGVEGARTSEPVGAMGVPALARTTSLRVLALRMGGGPPLGEEDASVALALTLTMGAGPLGEEGTTLGFF
jgi:hypothetical protein